MKLFLNVVLRKIIGINSPPQTPKTSWICLSISSNLNININLNQILRGQENVTLHETSVFQCSSQSAGLVDRRNVLT